MKVLRVKKFPLFDIFFGEGWENWTRVQVNKDRSMKVVGGLELDKQAKQKVSTHLINNFFKDQK
jgi:hypothetical protein